MIVAKRPRMKKHASSLVAPSALSRLSFRVAAFARTRVSRTLASAATLRLSVDNALASVLGGIAATVVWRWPVWTAEITDATASWPRDHDRQHAAPWCPRIRIKGGPR